MLDEMTRSLSVESHFFFVITYLLVYNRVEVTAMSTKFTIQEIFEDHWPSFLDNLKAV